MILLLIYLTMPFGTTSFYRKFHYIYPFTVERTKLFRFDSFHFKNILSPFLPTWILPIYPPPTNNLLKICHLTHIMLLLVYFENEVTLIKYPNACMVLE